MRGEFIYLQEIVTFITEKTNVFKLWMRSYCSIDFAIIVVAVSYIIYIKVYIRCNFQNQE